MKNKGFTLVELLAVIVILGIILAIAIPGITGIIESARKGAFEDSVKLILKSISTKQAIDNNYSVDSIDTNTMEEQLGIGNNNYQSISALTSGDKIYVSVIGKNKWNGLEAYGTLSNLTVDNGAAYATAPESCFDFDNATGTIVSYDLENSSCPTSLIIPDTINGVLVEHIGRVAFADPTSQYCGWYDEHGSWSNEQVAMDYIHTEGDGYDECYFIMPPFASGSITGVRLPFHLKTIEEYAFSNNQLLNVIIPNGVTKIGDYAFSTNRLINITIPNSVTTIGRDAFNGNQVTSLVLPNGLTSISEEAFAGNQLANVTIPDSVTTIDDWAFEFNQLTSITIPDSVTTIGVGAFAYNYLTHATLSDSTTMIDTYAFYDNELSSITIPDSVTTIGASSFATNQLTSLTLGTGATEIKGHAFENNRLTNLHIPNNITTIGHFAFYNNLLTNIDIPSSVTFIGFVAFNNNQLPYNQAFIYDRDINGVVNNEIIIGYGGAERANVIIPDGVTELDVDSFYSNQLTGVTIPSSVTHISNQVFAFNRLTSISLPSGTVNIGSQAFFKTTTSNPGLTTIINPSGNSFDWGEAVNGNSGYNFVTGTVVNDEGDVVVSAS